MKHELVNINTASVILKIDIDVVRYRCKMLKISARNGGRIMLDENQLDQIRNFKRPKNVSYKTKYDKKNILIVEYYLSNKNNSIPDISKNMGLSNSKVNLVISQFLKDGCITIESNLNKV